MRPARSLAPRRAIIALALAIAAIAGCSTDGRLIPNLTAPSPDAIPPVADSPTAVLERLRWAVNHRSIQVYRELFTGDFTFQFGLADPAGNAWRDTPWTREDELTAAQHLFVGGSATQEPATRITLSFTNELHALPDTRAGKDPTVHKVVGVDVLLEIQCPTAGDLRVTGTALFCVVRGDSANATGLDFALDPMHWYIERWEDYTIQAGATPARLLPAERPLPMTQFSWGSIKVLFR